MVSDIVLLKELPDIIRSSVAAYVGCISGAMMKEEYLEAIKNANFDEVRVLDEAVFPIEFLANDPTAKAMINKMDLSAEAVKEAASSVASIKVTALKR